MTVFSSLVTNASLKQSWQIILQHCDQGVLFFMNSNFFHFYGKFKLFMDIILFHSYYFKMFVSIKWIWRYLPHCTNVGLNYFNHQIKFTGSYMNCNYVFYKKLISTTWWYFSMQIHAIVESLIRSIKKVFEINLIHNIIST